jgi:D-alanine-D-alanine ligase-like ATP-grasp enzyme
MDKDNIIFVNAIRPTTFKALRDYEAQSGRHFTPIILVDSHIKESIFERNGQNNLPEEVTVITADFTSATSIREALKPYDDRIFAVTSQYENCIQELRALLPYLPYLPTPTEKSLIWSTEKKVMRKMLEAYDQSLVPGYMEAIDASEATIQEIESKLPYPLVVKPSGLEGSLLVTYVEDRDQLVDTLKRTFLTMQEAYDVWIKRQKPAVLVEEFMVGDMYTIDVYVDAQGVCRYTPPVEDIVGRKVGYDDLFGYKASLPSNLDADEIQKAQEAASRATYAVGLRSSTAHVEMMRTASGWKIIELGPRIGGYRYELYDRAYGINHIANDILNRGGEEPSIPTEVRNYVSVFDIYAHEEGILKAIHGIDVVEKLASFTYSRQNIYVGEAALFARNNGDVVYNVMLSHSDKVQLEADVEVLEKVLVLEVTDFDTDAVS